jgi:hypothetical protein
MIMIMNGFWKIAGTKQKTVQDQKTNIENYQYNGIPIAVSTHDTYTLHNIVIPKE